MSRQPKPLAAGDKVTYTTSRGTSGKGKFVCRQQGPRGDWVVVNTNALQTLTLRPSQVARR